MIRFFSKFNINDVFLAAAIFIFNHNNINSMAVRINIPPKNDKEILTGYCELPGCYCERNKDACKFQICTPESFCTSSMKKICCFNFSTCSLCVFGCYKLLKKCCRGRR